MPIEFSARRLLFAVASALLLCVFGVTLERAGAVEVDSLYTVEVNLSRAEGDGDLQNWAYGEALQTVLLRVTGSEAAAQDEDLLALFPDPARYVMRFRSGDDNALVVTLDGAAIEGVLRSVNQPVWGSDRPLTLVWLAADWGSGEREIVGADDGQSRFALAAEEDRQAVLRERVLKAAERRGLPVLFPLLDSEDRAAVRFSDIWGGFDQAVMAASRRYGTASVLVGRVRDEDPTGNRWSYYFGSQQLSWTGSPEMALERLANALAEQFSYTGSGSADQVTLTVSGVDSVAAFGAVRQILSELSMVETYRIDTVEGGDIRYRMAVQGGPGRLASALEFSGVLEPLDGPLRNNYSSGDAARQNLDYRYRPRSLAPAETIVVPEGEVPDDSQS